MNDATPWVDPELVAAGKLLQRGPRRARPHPGAAFRGARRRTGSARFSAKARCR